ncbi:hypothetical protein K3495_g4470 [Podosphaera aphanis]|nr:hypothetical protein K3495_g4470 [Podosphaera aphanis]
MEKVVQVVTNLQMDKFIFEEVPGLRVAEGSSSKTEDADDKTVIVTDGNIKAALLQLIPEDVFYIDENKATSKEMWDYQ